MRLALDVGCPKRAAARVTPAAPVRHPRADRTPPREVWGAAEDLLRALAGSGLAGDRRAADGADVEAVGISCAGPVDLVAGTVAPINIPEWSGGFALRTAVRTAFPGASVRMVADGAAIALGEHRHGAGRGVDDLLALVTSTGVGGGIVLGGRLVPGRTGNAGHIGHVVAVGGTEQCACGGIGCLETVASGPAAVRWATARGWSGRTGVDLARDAGAGDPVASAALARAGTALGEAVASAAALLDVELAVVGGGFSAAGAPLWNPLIAAARRHARLSFLAELQVVPAQLGSAASLAGAATLAGEDPPVP